MSTESETLPQAVSPPGSNRPKPRRSPFFISLLNTAKRPFYLAALSTECLVSAIFPSSWAQPVRARLARQILFSGIEAVPFTLFAGLLLGVVTTFVASEFLQVTGRIDFLALSILFFREAAPFFTLVILICASASAITSEISTMRITGEVDLIEAQGINAIQYLILPRAIGLAISAAGISLLFATATVLASAGAIVLSGRILVAPFLDSIFQSISLADFINLFGRSIIAAFLTGCICCYEGLIIRGAITLVPQAVTIAMLRSVGVTLIISAIFALITYL